MGRGKAMNFSLKRIDHVEVYVGDIAEEAGWYERVLGLKEILRWDPEPVMIGVGSTKLALFRKQAGKAQAEGELAISSGCRISP
ncbi:MAG TPA: VOC family protein [Candidatus Acidoferrales bacterium]|nr:VOC family protein [Candidatus Acidoferrales bacterium]